MDKMGVAFTALESVGIVVDPANKTFNLNSATAEFRLKRLPAIPLK